jgi:hypothetical protein
MTAYHCVITWSKEAIEFCDFSDNAIYLHIIS